MLHAHSPHHGGLRALTCVQHACNSERTCTSLWASPESKKRSQNQANRWRGLNPSYFRHYMDPHECTRRSTTGYASLGEAAACRSRDLPSLSSSRVDSDHRGSHARKTHAAKCVCCICRRHAEGTSTPEDVASSGQPSRITQHCPRMTAAPHESGAIGGDYWLGLFCPHALEAPLTSTASATGRTLLRGPRRTRCRWPRARNGIEARVAACSRRDTLAAQEGAEK